VGTARAARPTGRVLSAVMVTVIGAVVVIGAPGAVVVLLPAEVNAVAYVTGSGPSATFVPQSSYRNCGGRGGCKTITQGVIERADGTRVNAEWDGEVPLGRPFSVRQPVWTWGPGSTLLHGLRDAIVVLVVGPVVDLGAFLLLFAGCRLARNGLIRRRLRRQAYRERGQAQPASVP
jgi:hypothetical protein